jgi:nucleoside-diphosphate-sugar epimerase
LLFAPVKASLEKRWNQEYDYVFNLASETKYDQPGMIYEEKVVEVAKAVIEAAKKHTGLKRIFDISTAQIYAHGSKPASEGGKVKPWTGIAEAKLKVEELWLQSGLPVVLLRPAIVYGPGDQSGLSTLRSKLIVD